MQRSKFQSFIIVLILALINGHQSNQSTPTTLALAPSITPASSPIPTAEVAALLTSATPLAVPSPQTVAFSAAVKVAVTVIPNSTPTIDQTATAVWYALTPTLAAIRMTNGTVNVRQLPNAESELVEAISAGTTVTTLGQQITADGHVWYNVQLQDLKQGWIQDDLLTFIGKPTESSIQSASVMRDLVVNNNQWAPLFNEYDGVGMVLVPRGCFYMGSSLPRSSPMSFQCIQKPFWIDITEVTNQQFVDFGSTASQLGISVDMQQPRDWISWQEASEFCSQKRNMRLPTELEWEFSASGPSNFLYPWGNDFIPQNLVFSPDINSRRMVSSPVGSILSGASWVGALDMSGNLFEWVSTDYDQRIYPTLYEENQTRVGNANLAHVHHGGAYFNNEIDYMRFSYRGYGTGPDKYVGFRCARDFQKSDFSN